MKLLYGTCLIAVVAATFLSGCALQPNAGDPAPDFTAALDTGEKANLQSLMGPNGVVLYFYPKDETPGCTTQACEFQKELKEFQDSGYRVVGVSVDTEESHQAFKSKHDLTLDLIADTDKAVANAYNVPTETDPYGTVGFRRTTFVISRDGEILERFEEPDPKLQVKLAKDALKQPF